MAEARVRLTKIDEYQFLTCLKHQVWGSEKARFADWRVGDQLAFIVSKGLAGLAEVSGEPYVSKQVVWDNGRFPHRIPLKFSIVLAVTDRPPILGPIREALISVWGMRWGLGLLNQWVLKGDTANTVLAAFTGKRNALPEFQNDIDALLEEAKRQREASTERAKTRRVKAEGPIQPRLTEPATEAKRSSTVPPTVETETDEAAHSHYQKLLVQLGKITGSSVWIAANDRSKRFKGKPLGEGCLESLPNLGLSKEATDRISLIDVIWIQKNAPVCAFEVETTTQVYSGLLRMSDLLALVPALNVKLFIVAPRERQAKVMRELARPTFEKIGLSAYSGGCRSPFRADGDHDSGMMPIGIPG